jgi:hypothetical protein
MAARRSNLLARQRIKLIEKQNSSAGILALAAFGFSS